MSGVPALSGLLIIGVIILGGFVGLIFLQIFLSKRDNRGVGLILPIISFVMAILIALVIPGYNMVTVRTSSDGDTVVEEYIGETVVIGDGITIEEDVQENSGVTSSVYIGGFVAWLIIFMIFNIPTAVYLLIYFVCRSKRRRIQENSPQKQLEKMNIQDLG